MSPARPANAPIVIGGPPHRLTGSVSVANTSDLVLSLGQARLATKGLPDAQVHLAAQIAPGSTDQVEVVAVIGPSTPPGRYQATMEVHGQSRQVVVDVEEAPAMTLRPARVWLPPGATTLELQVTNTGNVPIRLAQTVAGTSVVTLLGHVEKGPEITLTFAAKPSPLGIGATRTFRASVLVPADLDPRRRHTALLPIGVADLRVVVLPQTADTPPLRPGVPATPTRATTPRRRRSTPATPKEQP